MSEREVFCGGLTPKGSRDGTIVLNARARDGASEKVNLRIEDVPARLADNVPDFLLDLLEIAAYVYFADQSIRRGGSKMNNMGAAWRRKFRIHVPVRSPELWTRPDVAAALTRTLGFLTEDEFQFELSQADGSPSTPYLGLSDPDAVDVNPDDVVLFSGGIDSFVGAANLLFQEGRRVALVTQRSSTLLTSKQTGLVSALRSKALPRTLASYPVSINKGTQEGVEFTQRSRSFMFAALAFIVAHMFGRDHALFFENGVVSINLPVAEHVIGSRASRTTHPRFLSDCGKLFGILRGRSFEFRNPFIWKTKTEVLKVGIDAGVGEFLGQTFSCTRVRDATKTGRQCGVCSQCVDRRFAFAAAGLSALDSPDDYAVELFQGAGIDRTSMVMAEGFVLRARRFETTTKGAFLGNHGQVYRALRDLPGPWEERADLLYDLHRRHGLEVRSVIDGKIRQLGMDLTELPRSCLLSMIVSETGPEPPSGPLAEFPALAPARYEPITFTAEENRVRFLGGPTITGRGASIVNGLLGNFDADTKAGLAHEAFRTTRANRLAESIRIGEPTLRQAIGRMRQRLARDFKSTSGRDLDSDDIVETREWKGYRLNPFLLHLTPEQFRNVEMSRDSKAGVTALSAPSQKTATSASADVTTFSAVGIDRGT